MKTSVLFLFIVCSSFITEAQEYPIDLKNIHQYFNEIKSICDADNGKRWSRNLWAPILVIDEKTRFVAANEADNEGKLKKTLHYKVLIFSTDLKVKYFK